MARRIKWPLRHRDTCNLHSTLCTHKKGERNHITIDPLPSVDCIADIAENESEENAIYIAQTEIDCLDDLSLEGDIPEDVSDTD